MGVNPKLWDATEKTFGNAHIHQVDGRVLPPVKYHHLPSLSVIDGSGKIYKFFGSTTPIAFSHFIEPLTRGIRDILSTDPTNCLFVLMDREAPKAKRANAARYARPNSISIETPPSQNPNKVEAWREFVLEYWMPKSDVENIMSNASDFGRYDWLVPPYTAPTPGKPTFGDYLNNPHFKLFFQEECCRFWAEHVAIQDSQWLAIMGSNDFFHLNRGANTAIRRSIFNFTFKEADPIIGHIIRVFDNYNINVISDDGDVIIVALLAQHHLRDSKITGYASVSQTKFERQCNVVWKWYPNKQSLVYFDIETLWRSINFITLEAWKRADNDIQGCPVMIFAIIAALNGNDYVRSLPQLSPEVYFKTFLTHAENFAQLTSDWDQGLDEPIRLNCSAIVELILQTYKTKFPSIVVDAKVEHTLAQIKKASGKRDVSISLADLRTRLGNLCFYLTYFINAQYAQPPPSEFMQTAAGESMYGYNAQFNEGKIEIVYTDVPNINHLDFYLRDSRKFLVACVRFSGRSPVNRFWGYSGSSVQAMLTLTHWRHRLVQMGTGKIPLTKFSRCR